MHAAIEIKMLYLPIYFLNTCFLKWVPKLVSQYERNRVFESICKESVQCNILILVACLYSDYFCLQ
jgi:hypothetical protein